MKKKYNEITHASLLEELMKIPRMCLSNLHQAANDFNEDLLQNILE